HGFVLRGDFWSAPCDINRSRPDYTKALADYNSALGLEPANPEIHNGLAKVHMALGDLDQAMTHANRAFSLKKAWGPYLCTLGEVFLRKGDYDGAFKDFRKGRLLVNGRSARNNWAWLMSTLPDSKYRDGAKAAKWMESALHGEYGEPTW